MGCNVALYESLQQTLCHRHSQGLRSHSETVPPLQKKGGGTYKGFRFSLLFCLPELRELIQQSNIFFNLFSYFLFRVELPYAQCTVFQ